MSGRSKYKNGTNGCRELRSLTEGMTALLVLRLTNGAETIRPLAQVERFSNIMATTKESTPLSFNDAGGSENVAGQLSNATSNLKPVSVMNNDVDGNVLMPEGQLVVRKGPAEFVTGSAQGIQEQPRVISNDIASKTVGVPSGDWRMQVGRQIIMGTYQWDMGFPVGKKIISKSFLDLIKAVPQFYEAMSSYRYVRCTPVVEIFSSVDPFGAGSLMAWFEMGPPQTGDVTPEFLAATVQYPYARVVVQEKVNFTLPCHFMTTNRYMETDDEEALTKLGSMHVAVFNSLKSCHPITISLAVRMESIDLKFFRESPLTRDRLTLQGKYNKLKDDYDELRKKFTHMPMEHCGDTVQIGETEDQTPPEPEVAGVDGVPQESIGVDNSASDTVQDSRVQADKDLYTAPRKKHVPVGGVKPELRGGFNHNRYTSIVDNVKRPAYFGTIKKLRRGSNMIISFRVSQFPLLFKQTQMFHATSGSIRVSWVTNATIATKGMIRLRLEDADKRGLIQKLNLAENTSGTVEIPYYITRPAVDALQTFTEVEDLAFSMRYEAITDVDIETQIYIHAGDDFAYLQPRYNEKPFHDFTNIPLIAFEFGPGSVDAGLGDVVSTVVKTAEALSQPVASMLELFGIQDKAAIPQNDWPNMQCPMPVHRMCQLNSDYKLADTSLIQHTNMKNLLTYEGLGSVPMRANIFAWNQGAISGQILGTTTLAPQTHPMLNMAYKLNLLPMYNRGSYSLTIEFVKCPTHKGSIAAVYHHLGDEVTLDNYTQFYSVTYDISGSRSFVFDTPYMNSVDYRVGSSFGVTFLVVNRLQTCSAVAGNVIDINVFFSLGPDFEFQFMVPQNTAYPYVEKVVQPRTIKVAPFREVCSDQDCGMFDKLIGGIADKYINEKVERMKRQLTNDGLMSGEEEEEEASDIGKKALIQSLGTIIIKVGAYACQISDVTTTKGWIGVGLHLLGDIALMTIAISEIHTFIKKMMKTFSDKILGFFGSVDCSDDGKFDIIKSKLTTLYDWVTSMISSVFPTLPLAGFSKFADIMRKVGAIGAGIRGIDIIFGLIKGVFKFLRNCFNKTSEPMKKLERAFKTEKFANQLSSMRFYVNNVGVSEVFADDNARSEICNLLKVCNDIIPMIKSEKKREILIIYETMQYFRNKFQGVQTPPAPTTDFEPVFVLIQGDPGGGKSTTAIRIAKSLGIDVGKGNCDYHQRKLTDRYWNGYAGQTTLVLDDLFQSVDGTENALLTNIITTVGFNVPMAELSDKNIMFSSGVVIGTTNTWNITGMQSPQAIMRRAAGTTYQMKKDKLFYPVRFNADGSNTVEEEGLTEKQLYAQILHIYTEKWERHLELRTRTIEPPNVSPKTLELCRSIKETRISGKLSLPNFAGIKKVEASGALPCDMYNPTPGSSNAGRSSESSLRVQIPSSSESISYPDGERPSVIEQCLQTPEPRQIPDRTLPNLKLTQEKAAYMIRCLDGPDIVRGGRSLKDHLTREPMHLKFVIENNFETLKNLGFDVMAEQLDRFCGGALTPSMVNNRNLLRRIYRTADNDQVAYYQELLLYFRASATMEEWFNEHYFRLQIVYREWILTQIADWFRSLNLVKVALGVVGTAIGIIGGVCLVKKMTSCDSVDAGYETVLARRKNTKIQVASVDAGLSTDIAKHIRAGTCEITSQLGTDRLQMSCINLGGGFFLANNHAVRLGAVHTIVYHENGNTQTYPINLDRTNTRSLILADGKPTDVVVFGVGVSVPTTRKLVGRFITQRQYEGLQQGYGVVLTKNAGVECPDIVTKFKAGSTMVTYKGLSKLRPGWVTDAVFEQGTCGSPMLSTDPYFNNCIIGIVSATNPVGGLVSFVYREAVEAAINEIHETIGEVTIPSVDCGFTQKAEYVMTPKQYAEEMEVMGYEQEMPDNSVAMPLTEPAEVASRINVNSKFKNVSPPPVFPLNSKHPCMRHRSNAPFPILGDGMPYLDNRPLICSRNESGPQEYCVIEARAMFDRNVLLKMSSCEVLQPKEILNGYHEVDTVNNTVVELRPINGRSASGYTFDNKFGQHKRDGHYDEIDGVRVMKEDRMQEILAMESKLRENVVEDRTFIISPKDELVSTAKCEAGKVREFYIDEFSFHYLTVKYFGDFIARYRALGLEGYHTIGSDPVKIWDQLAKWFKKNFSGDVSMWDRQVPSWAFEELRRCIEIAYPGSSVGDRNARFALLNSGFFSTCVMAKQQYLAHGQKSGVFGTSEFNSVIHTFIIYYVLTRLSRPMAPDYEIRKKVIMDSRFVSNGDDMMIQYLKELIPSTLEIDKIVECKSCIDRKQDIRNFDDCTCETIGEQWFATQIVEGYAECGLTVTDPLKSGKPRVVDIINTEYLKRKFAKRKLVYGGYVYTPQINMAVVNSFLVYIRAGVDLMSNIKDGLTFLHQSGNVDAFWKFQCLAQQAATFEPFSWVEVGSWYEGPELEEDDQSWAYRDIHRHFKEENPKRLPMLKALFRNRKLKRIHWKSLFEFRYPYEAEAQIITGCNVIQMVARSIADLYTLCCQRFDCEPRVETMGYRDYQWLNLATAAVNGAFRLDFVVHNYTEEEPPSLYKGYYSVLMALEMLRNYTVMLERARTVFHPGEGFAQLKQYMEMREDEQSWAAPTYFEYGSRLYSLVQATSVPEPRRTNQCIMSSARESFCGVCEREDSTPLDFVNIEPD